uniref:WWE domain-containing protein n=1 Tax=Heterorhabditis bacteriophora TaxID=37862 RepID=A0A1I7X2C3_HETBA
MTSRSATRSMFVCHIVTYRTEPPCIVPLLKSLCPASQTHVSLSYFVVFFYCKGGFTFHDSNTLLFDKAASEDLEEKQRVVGVGEPVREDYWYYDVASDGYYYEQNGAKGWRRRMPNSAMQRIKEQVL